MVWRVIFYRDANGNEPVKDFILEQTEVEYCLNNHDVSYHDKKGNPIYITETPNGRRIKVVAAREDARVVITVGD